MLKQINEHLDTENQKLARIQEMPSNLYFATQKSNLDAGAMKHEENPIFCLHEWRRAENHILTYSTMSVYFFTQNIAT